MSISCIKNKPIKSQNITRELTYIVSINKNTNKIEIIKFETDNKSNLIITLKNNRKTDIKQSSLAIFKKGNKTGHIIKEGLRAGERKKFKLNIKVNKRKKNVFHIFLKQD
ncbi:hypothetical protein LKV13_02415 [Borrelia sp. BU AG58]|uniref:hypothetical protein n=1 Tax=Borrelia sp. BU AG58 TaxID=2887345 RepID=UPI001E3BE013|nr:hypothetical protein [Borrelia sp. BU AG58]UER67643.1 hypothetical protein LKV13_02415 [Borrelia sp. BU AG58]